MSTYKMFFAGSGGQGVLLMGQMITDVQLALNGRLPTFLAHRTGGMVPTSPEVAARAKAVLEGLK